MYMYDYMNIYMCMYMSIAFEIDPDPADHLILEALFCCEFSEFLPGDVAQLQSLATYEVQVARWTKIRGRMVRRGRECESDLNGCGFLKWVLWDWRDLETACNRFIQDHGTST